MARIGGNPPTRSAMRDAFGWKVEHVSSERTVSIRDLPTSRSHLRADGFRKRSSSGTFPIVLQTIVPFGRYAKWIERPSKQTRRCQAEAARATNACPNPEAFPKVVSYRPRSLGRVEGLGRKRCAYDLASSSYHMFLPRRCAKDRCRGIHEDARPPRPRDPNGSRSHPRFPTVRPKTRIRAVSGRERFPLFRSSFPERNDLPKSKRTRSFHRKRARFFSSDPIVALRFFSSSSLSTQKGRVRHRTRFPSTDGGRGRRRRRHR